MIYRLGTSRDGAMQAGGIGSTPRDWHKEIGFHSTLSISKR
jgi:hypothetical protein